MEYPKKKTTPLPLPNRTLHFIDYDGIVTAILTSESRKHWIRDGISAEVENR
jgi:hypothetical protein